MSRSLHFEIASTPIHPGLAPIEHATWSQFRLFVKGRCVTEFQQPGQDSVSNALHLPLFPIAEWLVHHWWALLFEPCRGETPPRENVRWRDGEKEWLSRHCLRTADSGLFLPYLHFYSNGKNMAIVWHEDALERSGDRFCTYGAELIERAEAERAFRHFVCQVLEKLDGIHDERVEQLRQDWKAICDADADERLFCEAAGRMGLDPYDVNSWPEGLETLLLNTLGKRLEEPIAGDFLESTDPFNAAALWDWIQTVEKHWPLKSHAPYYTEAAGYGRAKDAGYFLADKVRSEMGLANGAPIKDLPEVANRLDGLNLTFTEHNHVPSENVRAVVGWKDLRTAAVVGPGRQQANQRFLMARGLCQVLVGCSRGARLLSNARTWDQQMGRAFAAELLAPKEALAEVARPDMDYEERDACQTDLAQKYGVSTVVIALQLENYGVW